MGVVLALVEVDLVVGRVSPFTSDDSPLFSTAFNVVAEVAKANPKSMPNNGDLVVIVVFVFVVAVVVFVVVGVVVVVVVVFVVVVVVVVVAEVVVADVVVTIVLDITVVRKVGDSVVVVPVCVNPSVVVPNSLKTGNMANKLL